MDYKLLGALKRVFLKTLVHFHTSEALQRLYSPHRKHNLPCLSPPYALSPSTGRRLAPLLKSRDTLCLKHVQYFTYFARLSLTTESLHNLLNHPAMPNILSIPHTGQYQTCRVHLITVSQSLEEETTVQMRIALTIKQSQARNHSLLVTSPPPGPLS